MDTPNPNQRRTLHFSMIDDITRDAQKLVAAERPANCANWETGRSARLAGISPPGLISASTALRPRFRSFSAAWRGQ